MRLFVVLGDQLDPALVKDAGDDDVIWMAEVTEESTHVWSHQQRIALFLSAMRHHRDALREAGHALRYAELDDAAPTLQVQLAADLEALAPDSVVLTQPGDHRVLRAVEETCAQASVPLELREDPRFFCTLAEFDAHAEGRKTLLMEHFYRWMRKKHGVLLDDGEPVGGRWNFDADNRKAFGKEGPGDLGTPYRGRNDELTEEVLALVADRFPDHPGSLDSFAWPVTRAQAKRALDAFVERHLPRFGVHQDAMWTGEPFLHHSLLASSMNLGLLSAREVVDAAERAYRRGEVPIASAEGFIRQVLGWREYVRGIYWRFMPEYLERNALGADQALPDFYWTGETPMRCLSESIGQTLQHGYAHHIQRLMVTGLYAMLLGVRPREVHEWYLAVYVDALEWVELPNTLGMSQFGDDGLMASKPYCASGSYLQRMSNYCRGCPFDPKDATGDDACPFTTLYWDFLARHEERLAKNHRMGLQLKNLAKKSDAHRAAVARRAKTLRADPAANTLARQGSIPST